MCKACDEADFPTILTCKVGKRQFQAIVEEVEFLRVTASTRAKAVDQILDMLWSLEMERN